MAEFAGSKKACKINAFSLENRENLDFSRWFEFARTSVFFCMLERTRRELQYKTHTDLDSPAVDEKAKDGESNECERVC